MNKISHVRLLMGLTSDMRKANLQIGLIFRKYSLLSGSLTDSKKKVVCKLHTNIYIPHISIPSYHSHHCEDTKVTTDNQSQVSIEEDRRPITWNNTYADSQSQVSIEEDRRPITWNNTYKDSQSQVPVEEDGRGITQNSKSPSIEIQKRVRLTTEKCEENLKPDTDHPLESEIERDDAVILKILNTATAEELFAYKNMREGIVKNIIDKREVEGPLKSLEELCKVKSVKQARAKQIVEVIKSNKKKSEPKRKLQVPNLTGKSAMAALSPPLKPHQGDAESVVGCCVTSNMVSWAHLDAGLTLCDWGISSLVTRNIHKLDHALYQNKVIGVMDNLPMSAIYLMEDIPFSVQNPQRAPGVVRRCYIEACLTTALNLRNHHQESSTHFTQLQNLSQCVHKIMNYGVARYFRLMVGGEQTSALKVLNEIHRGHCEEAYGVIIPNYLMDRLREYELGEQELIARALLQTVTFYKDIVKSDEN